ncbi:hypothetical protein MULP_03839 [Mycobacterium liflandii 128FXT]|uniref:Uncharacterized protein n=1 Tax=Mycobacterium liflandii (strain 128FXT) TaxID=459424 RepID=L7VAJ0_MYCL1|nr:hypothetical protein MULP_03839 [Mycobacterium liflandii 128FXT]
MSLAHGCRYRPRLATGNTGNTGTGSGQWAGAISSC